MGHDKAVQAERQRRLQMWEAVQWIQLERPLTADEVGQIGCYNGARGIWRDKTTTANLSAAYRQLHHHLEGR